MRVFTKTWNGLEWSSSVLPGSLHKSFNLGLGIPKLRFLESEAEYSMALGKMGNFVPDFSNSHL